MRTGFHIAPIRWHMTVMLLVCIVFMVIGIATKSWAHYQFPKSAQQFGLWRTCTYNDKGVVQECKDTGYLLEQIVLVISVIFCLLALLCIFCIINKIIKKLTSIIFLLCMVISATLGWCGVGLFIEEIELKKTTADRKYEWSIILFATGVVMITILLPFALWYVFCEKRKDRPQGKYAPKEGAGQNGVSVKDGVVNKGVEADMTQEKQKTLVTMEQAPEVVKKGGSVVLKTFTPLPSDAEKKVTIRSPPSEADVSRVTIDEVASEEFDTTASETSESESETSFYSEEGTIESAKPVEPVKKPGYSSLTLHSTDVALKDLESYLEQEEYAFV